MGDSIHWTEQDRLDADRRASKSAEKGRPARQSPRRFVSLVELLDAAADLHCDIVLWERDTPGAADVVRRWAEQNGAVVRENMHASRGGLPAFRTVMVDFATNLQHYVCVHMPDESETTTTIDAEGMWVPTGGAK